MMNTTKAIGHLLILGALTLATLPALVFLQQKDTRAAVRIETGSALGSGFLISETQVMTAEHVVEGVPEGEPVEVFFENRTKGLKATVFYKDKLSDVAILILPKEDTINQPIQKLDCRPFKREERISHIGNPYGIRFWHSEGLVGAYTQSFEEMTGRWPEVNFLSLPAGPGSSGGPVFDKDKEVVGMIVGQHGRNTGFLLATPGNVLCIQKEKALGSSEAN